MAYNGAGSLFALGLRITKLAPNGAPLVGPENSYVTPSLVQLEIGLEYEDGEQLLQRNGAGNACMTYRAPDSLVGATISALQVCVPDPVVLQFLAGGTVIYDSADNPIGYQAPEVGVDPQPNGVSVEFATRQIISGTEVGYFWWAIPKARLRPAEGWTATSENFMVPEFEGTASQNANWGDGPQNDFIWPSNRVWQYVQIDEPLVDFEPARFLPVVADLTVTTLEVTPATATVGVGDTVELTATATMSDSSTRDVTAMATWSSVNSAIASVSEGVVTGESVGGPTNVTATYLSQSDSSAITVEA